MTEWDDAASILTTRLAGGVTIADVDAWKRSLEEGAKRIPPGRAFKLLYDLHGYEPADLDAHKAMRDVIPLFLARHGMRPAVIDLFDVKPEVEVTDDGRRCVAFANVHHDPAKMESYESRIAKPNQRFFTDPATALAWLRSLAC